MLETMSELWFLGGGDLIQLYRGSSNETAESPSKLQYYGSWANCRGVSAICLGLRVCARGSVSPQTHRIFMIHQAFAAIKSLGDEYAWAVEMVVYPSAPL